MIKKQDDDRAPVETMTPKNGDGGGGGGVGGGMT